MSLVEEVPNNAPLKAYFLDEMHQMCRFCSLNEFWG